MTLMLSIDDLILFDSECHCRLLVLVNGFQCYREIGINQWKLVLLDMNSSQTTMRTSLFTNDFYR
jgi:hypothetical protein